MKEEAAIFESIYADYLAQVARLDVAAIADQLGVEVQDDEIRIPFFHKAFSLTPRGIADEKGHKPHHALCVVLCKYLLLCPAALGPPTRRGAALPGDLGPSGPGAARTQSR